MDRVTKDQLLARRVDTETGLPEEDVPVAGLGTVRVRGLTRDEVVELRSVDDMREHECKTLACGLLDPKLSEAEVREWRKVAVAGELTPVVNRIMWLSGMAGGSAKEAYKSLRDRSGSGVRVLPGGEAGDDGGVAEAGDVAG